MTYAKNNFATSQKDETRPCFVVVVVVVFKWLYLTISDLNKLQSRACIKSIL